ncbi:cation:proton antiporter, partial [Kibdelosporangium lantanae]
PVAVTALARRLSLPPRVQALVQAESLFNDATSLLLFRFALSLAVTVSVSWRHTVSEFALLAVGGVLVGAFVALGAYLIRSRTEDPVLETVVALVTPYGAYVLAESVNASGVTAVVVASVVLGTQATRLTTAHIRLQLGAVYETVVFLLESVVFGLIGLQLPTLVRQLEGTDSRWPLYALAIAATLIVVRLLWVFPLSAVLQRKRGARPSCVEMYGRLAESRNNPFTTSTNRGRSCSPNAGERRSLHTRICTASSSVTSVRARL